MPEVVKPDYRSNNLDIEKWLGAHSVEVTRTADFEFSFICPWQSLHNDEEMPPIATLTQNPHEWPTFKCPHDSCKEKSFVEFIKVYGNSEKYTARFAVKPGEVMPADPNFKSEYFIRPLGLSKDGYYWYQCGPEGHVLSLRPEAHKEGGFIHLVSDTDFWANKFSNAQRNIDWKRARSYYMTACKQAGMFTPDLIRGSGAWWDDGRIVVNLGGSLLVDGVPTALYDIKSKFIYERSTAIPESGRARYASDEDLCQILRLAELLPFADDHAAVIAAGLAVVGFVPGLLSWRPSLWLNGRPGMGKTFISEQFFRALWKPCGGLAQQADTTAAGIREAMDRKSVSVIVDDQRPAATTTATARLEDLIAMIRGSASNFGGQVTHGGIAHGRHSIVKACFVINSVEYPVRDKQDRERIFNLRCDSNKRRATVAEMKDVLTPEFSSAVFMRVSRDSKSLIKVISDFISMLWDSHKELGLTQRYCDQWGTVIGAAWWSQNPSRELTRMEAVEFFKKYYVREAYEMDVASEESENLAEQCLQAIMSFIPPGEKRTLGDAVWEIFDLRGGSERDGRTLKAMAANQYEIDNSPEAFLGRCALRVMTGKLVVGSGNDRLKTAVGRKGINNYIAVLADLEGAEMYRKAMKFGGANSATIVEIPLETVFPGGHQPLPKLAPPPPQDHLPPRERFGAPDPEEPLPF